MSLLRCILGAVALILLLVGQVTYALAVAFLCFDVCPPDLSDQGRAPHSWFWGR